MNLADLLWQNGERLADRTAFVQKGKSCSFGELLDRVKTAAAALRREGVRPGDQVILLQPVSREFYVAMMALWSLGASVVVFDPSASAAYINSCLERVEPRVFVGCAKAMVLKLKLARLRQVERTIPISRLGRSGGEGLDGPLEVEESAPALITFTSGSTGRPKVAVRTHGFLLCQYRCVAENMDYRDSDVDLAVLPVFTLANLARGIATVIPDDGLTDISKVRMDRVIPQMRRHGVTRITASPALVQAMAEHCIQNRVELPAFRGIHIGGGPVFPHTLESIQKAFPQGDIHLVYGSTEAEPIAQIAYRDLDEECFAEMEAGGGLMGGCVVPQIQCRVIRDHHPHPMGQLTREAFAELCLDSGAGEIVVSGEHVLSGYKDGVGDEENKFRVGDMVWHRTGDLGRFDHRGRLWLLGRAAAKIVDGRGTLYPFSVECGVCAAYKVPRCALLSLDGRRVLAVEASREICAPIAEDRRFPLDVVLDMAAIPLDSRHRSKIDYPRLEREIRGRLEQEG